MFDYETLKMIWWLLVGVLLVGFAIMDGHDMGVGTLLPFVGKDDTSAASSSTPSARTGTATRSGSSPAAAPSSPPGRWSTPPPSPASTGPCWPCCGRCSSARWASTTAARSTRRALAQTWDWGLFVGGAVPPLIFGVAFGNLLQGVPFHSQRDVDRVPAHRRATGIRSRVSD
jgi:cytochrome d ubiquinol oxidase subunit II